MRQRVSPREHFRRGNAATILIVALHTGVIHHSDQGSQAALK